ncbi:MAG: hypothetical protein DRQ62_07080 [Gammaproteobacteria bacterium]|nr:MAG: hypothetical protein DRQ62_07080 [Gammaproteobacteria bacterium]
MALQDLNIFCYYDRARFAQFSAMDCANWYNVQAPSGKAQQALYPTMGRRHINFLNQNKLIFNAEPRALFKTIDFMYVIVGAQVIQVDNLFNQRVLINNDFNKTQGDVWFDFISVGTQVYAMLTAQSGSVRKAFIITEDGANSKMEVVTDVNAPVNPLFVATFGNRFAVSASDSPVYALTKIGVPLPGDVFSPAGQPLFNSASGKVRQMGVLFNQLYIFTDFHTDVWANIPTQFEGEVFPWKLNTSYNFDVGISDPFSLSIDFGVMCFLSRNKNGLVEFVMSDGRQPQSIGSQAVNVVLQEGSNEDLLSPFIDNFSNGFLYQYENTIFYRVVAGDFLDLGNLDITDSANCLEYNFTSKQWHRCIELNGERNRIQQHVFFNSKHIVSVVDDFTLYQMAGNIYYNEVRNQAQSEPNAPDAYSKFPMRYELVTKAFYQKGYTEFITDYIEIDFVFGNETFYKSCAPYDNAVYMVDETSTPENPLYLVTEDDKFIVTEDSNTPSFSDNHYCDLFKPHVELYFSDDGGVSFHSADLREFSPLGVYRYRMRWYELGASRNRVYKLVCVSSAPIVILGAIQNIRKSSGGAN